MSGGPFKLIRNRLQRRELNGLVRAFDRFSEDAIALSEEMLNFGREDHPEEEIQVFIVSTRERLSQMAERLKIEVSQKETKHPN
jgi:hypothetical protein